MPHLLVGSFAGRARPWARGGSTAGVQATLDDLQQATGAQLWVWYTNTLGGQVSGDFAAATAEATGLGTPDVIRVVALGGQVSGDLAAATAEAAHVEADGFRRRSSLRLSTSDLDAGYAVRISNAE